MDIDYEFDERECVICGHSPTHIRRCSECHGEGEFDCYDEDPINYSPGEEMETCETCHGSGIEHWCPKCGADQAALELLPCPFCGSSNVLVTHAGLGVSHVICRDCYATGPQQSWDWDNTEDVWIAKDVWNIKESNALIDRYCKKYNPGAVEKWNKRT